MKIAKELETLNTELYAQIRAGDRAARDKFIEANLFLVRHCAKQVLGTKDPQWRDALGEGHLALVEAAEKLMTEDTENVGGYCATAIKNAIKDYCGNAPMIKAARTTRYRKSAEGNSLKPKETCRLFVALPAKEPLGPVDELLSDILEACKTERERAIVQGFADGKTAPQLAVELDVHRDTIYEDRQAVADRYFERDYSVAA